MVDRVQRDLDIVTETAKREGQTRIQEVQVDELTVTTHTAVFADGPGGTGTPGRRSRSDGPERRAPRARSSGQNEVIVAQGDTGPINVTNPVQLPNGQALIGGGTSVAVTLIGGPKDGQRINLHASPGRGRR